MKKIKNFSLVALLFAIVLFGCNTKVNAQTSLFTVVGTGSAPAVHVGPDTTYFKSTINSTGTTNFHILARGSGTSPTATGTIVWFVSSDGVTYFPHPDTAFASKSFTGSGVVGPNSTGTAYVSTFNYSWTNIPSANSFKFVMARVITTAVGGSASPSWQWSGYQTIRRTSGY